MKMRWLAGLTLFALGFGCAQMMKITPAEAEDGIVEEGLRFLENPSAFELTNTGSKHYLVVVDRDADAQVDEPQAISKTGSVTISKEGLKALTLIELRAVAQLIPGNPEARECNPEFEDCPSPEPLPEPRPPRMVFFKPERGI